jgi:23S rRNA (cytidine1920-2'-O)/16S rRNA (cytidine1409-2'-O)-methyltransferase
MKRLPLLRRLQELYPQHSRQELYARVLCGEVLVDGERVRDPRTGVAPTAEIRCLPGRRFVSRGGEKLEGVLSRWGQEVTGMTFLDAGASTGGFTDCLLQRGARAVLAVERGRNQLDYRLRRDRRVVLLEGTNVMDLRPDSLPLRPEAAVADLSLRSLRGAASHILSLVSQGWMIALVKPQYELRRPPESFSGVLRSLEALRSLLRQLAGDLQAEGLEVYRVTPSLLPGAAGNREYFFGIRRLPANRGEADLPAKLEALLAEAFPG